MIDVLSGATKVAEADATLMGYFPTAAADKKIYLDHSPDGQKVYPRAVIRHVRTDWKRAKNMGGTAVSRYDETTFEFIAHSDSLPDLNRIQLRLRALFDTLQPFALIDADGNTVSTATAKMVSCMEQQGGNIESLPQANMQQKSIHRLKIRFKCEVTRHP